MSLCPRWIPVAEDGLAHVSAGTVYLAISLKDPWGPMIISRRKTIETRTWRPNLRGTIIICSSASNGRSGQALGMVDLVDDWVMTEKDVGRACCNVYPRAIAWSLRNARPFARPFDVKGKLNFWALMPDPKDAQ